MKTKILITIALAILSGGTMVGLTWSNKQINYLRFQHTRDSLIIDSLRNPVDTTEFLTEHSEIGK